MKEIRECVKELFEISETNYFLAKSILTETNLKIDYYELDYYLGKRSINVKLFIEFALDYVNDISIEKEELVRNIKGTVLMRTNSCIYLLIKHRAGELSIKDIFLFIEKHSWSSITNSLPKVADNVPVSKCDFDYLIDIYCKKEETFRNFAERMLLRIPKESIPFLFIDSNKMNAIDYLGRICRSLILAHYGEKQSNDELIKMLLKDYGSNRYAYEEQFSRRIELGIIPKSFWEKFMESGTYELKELALNFINKYSPCESDKIGISKFCVKYGL